MTSIPTPSQVSAQVAAAASPGQRDLAAQVAQRLAEVQAASLRGENVEDRLRVLRVAADNLDDHTRTVIYARLEQWALLVLRIGLGIVMR